VLFLSRSRRNRVCVVILQWLSPLSLLFTGIHTSYVLRVRSLYQSPDFRYRENSRILEAQSGHPTQEARDSSWPNFRAAKILLRLDGPILREMHIVVLLEKTNSLV
jgi:hypothetical protein